jgi:hypothetical protein
MGAIALASGLQNIPKADGSSGTGTRNREVWIYDDWRLFDRACKVVRKHGDRLLLKCGAELCPSPNIVLEADASAERGAVLRCGCTDRVFSRS